MANQSAPNRNTLNQRASRARRKDYIHDLEHRLHEYEAHGIQATAEVQSAARRVAAENSALRDELAMLRQRCADLEQKISDLTRGGMLEGQSGGMDVLGTGRRRGRGRSRAQRRLAISRRSLVSNHQDREVIHPTKSTRPRTSNTMTQDLSQTPSPGPSMPSKVAHIFDLHAAHATPPEDESPSPWPPSDSSSADLDFPSSPSVPPFPFRTPIQTTEYPTQPVLSLPQSHSPPIPLCSPLPFPNSTPCLQAALIIASMRGIPPDEHTLEASILPELGCSGPASRPRCISSGACRSHGSEDRNSTTRDGKLILDCAVDNGRLFGILAGEG